MARSKEQTLHLHQRDQNLNSNGTTKQQSKTLSSQIKEMYRHCAPCGVQSPEWQNRGEIGTPGSRRRVESVVFVEESEQKEWVAQVETGVLVTFLSLIGGGNHLKRIRFSREVFDKQQAQRWWAENHEKVVELYNVQRVNRGSLSMPRTESSTSSQKESAKNSPMSQPLACGSIQANGKRTGCSSTDSLAHESCNCTGLTSTPKSSTRTSDAKTETSSAAMSATISTTSSFRNADISPSNISDMGTDQWVEQDEPGVYITVRALPGGRRELIRVRFSREKFEEMHARLWWEENRARIHKQYLHLDSTG